MKFLALFLISGAAFADVLSCKTGITGPSIDCGGCSVVAYQPAGYDIFVKTDASAAWTPFQNLKITDSVYVGTIGTACAAAVKTLVSALGATPPPITPPIEPPTTPPVNPTPPAGAGSFPVTCTAPTRRVDGSPVDSLTYIFVVNGSDYAVGSVCRYDPVNPLPGNYQIAVKAQDSSGISSPSNPVAVFVPTPTTPPVTPPSTVLTTEILGTWTLKKGTTNVQTGLFDYPACKAAAGRLATTTATKYFCAVSNTITVKLQ